MDKEQWRKAAQSFESSLMILRKDKNGWVVGFSVHPNDVPDALLDAPLGTRFQQVLFQIGDDEEPVVTTEGPKRRNTSVAKAGALCRSREFQSFFLGNDSEEDREVEVAKALCKELGISSRSEIAPESEAEEEFLRWVKSFNMFQMQDV